MPHQQRRLREDTAELKAIARDTETQDAVVACNLLLMARGLLLSPGPQIQFFLGMLLATRSPDNPVPLQSKTRFARLVELLNSTCQGFVDEFFPVDASEKPEEWKRAADVALPAFLHYWHQGSLATPLQVRDQIRRLLSPFDAELRVRAGISATETLLVINAIAARVKAQTQRLNISVRLDELRRDVGDELATSYWHRFSASRGDFDDVRFFAATRDADLKCLYTTGDGEAVFVCVNALFNAALASLEHCLQLDATCKARLARARASVLERRVVEITEKMFGNVVVHPSVFETPDLHNEHDVVIVWNRRLIVFEAKSSAMRAPLRDPRLAFPLLRDDFRSDKGIQHAYDQANRILKRLRAGQIIELFDESGARVLRVGPGDIDSSYAVCVTATDFGPLATDLSILLDKEGGDPFPWAVNADALELIAEAWPLRSWGPEEFCVYLEQRQKLHGRFGGADELELAGYMLNHGSLAKLLELDADKICLPPSASDVFDTIYLMAEGGPPPQFGIPDPEFHEIREDPHFRRLFEDIIGAPPPEPKSRPQSRNKRKLGRNDPCHCGSGKKYKICHWKGDQAR